MIKDHGIIDQTYAYFDKKAPVLFYILSAEGRIVDANRYAETISGLNLKGEKIQDLFVDFTGKFDLESLLRDSSKEQLLHIRTRSGLPQSFYFTFQKMDDRILAFGRLDTVEIENMRKEVLSLNQELSIASRQLHKQNAQFQQINEKLRKSEERLGLAMKATQDAVWDWDLLAGTLYYSPHWWRMIGYAENELAADPDLWRRLMHPEDLERASSIVSEAIAGEISFEVESRLLHKDGHYVPVLTRGFILREDSGKPVRVSGTNTDLTGQKKIEAERGHWERQRQQLQKAESLNLMAGAIAHHFNNQLQVVTGNLEMAMDDLPRNSPIADTLTEAMKAARKAAEVSVMMVAYRGQSSGKHTSLDLSEICRRSLPLLRTAAPKNVILKTDVHARCPVIHANADQIGQVLTSLVTNAWEAAGEYPATVTLTVKTVSWADIPASKRFPIAWTPPKIDHVCMEVKDTGIGIDGGDIEKLFDPFFTTKFIGRGMGLSVVLGIVGAHGGCVTVESKRGRGSVFRVFLPAPTEEIPIWQEKPVTAPKIEESATVLLIEDEEQVRSMAKKMLTRLGYRVLEATDGVEALAIFQEHQNEIRCVLSDLTMPRMDGWDTLDALRKLSPDIPVILSSGYDEAQVMADEHNELPNAFLGKPYRSKDLDEAIHRVLEKGATHTSLAKLVEEVTSLQLF